ncbi:MAG: carbon-monoxide dehydrogenase large subunit [Alphaproteobacteria bacterium]|jgi:carbon-monoxide dehydrogenase large subunit
MSEDEFQFRTVGQPLRRKEDERLVTGQGQFSDDFSLDGQGYAAIVRSPHPHARIKSYDIAAALAVPGVLGVFTGADCIADGLEAIPHYPLPKTKYDLKLAGPNGSDVFIGPHVLLPADKVRHVGEAVVLVVGDTRAAALDGVELIDVEYEELPFVLTVDQAMQDSAVEVWDELPGNVLVDTEFGDSVATSTAFAAADHVVEARFHIDRVTGVPMEPRAALAAYDDESGRYTLYAGSGGAVKQKAELAVALGIEADQLRILSYDVGGNFGTRNRVYVEYGLVLWASAKLRRPVKYTATRSESFLSDYQGRDLVTTVELALAADGRFLAMRADNISNAGARCVSLSPLGKGSGLITGSYNIPCASLRSRSVFTNTVPTQAYRSSGRPEVTYAIERLVEKAAKELKIDAIELRRRNLVAPEQMPYTNAVGMTYDSGTYESNLDQAMRLLDWNGFAARRREVEARGQLLGRGLAHYVESSIGAPKERAEVRVRTERRIDVVVGTQPSGQGHETSFAQVMADLLFVTPNEIAITYSDTDIVKVGGGSHSGRSMRHAATVMAMASVGLIARGKAIATLLFNCAADDVVFDEGRFGRPGINHTFDWFELAVAIEGIELPDELADGLIAISDNEMHDPVFPNGCAACEIEIDPSTGAPTITRYVAVDDVGRCINPMIVHGQTHGGIAQGVGQAMFEHCYYEPETGQPLTGSFMDYTMPRADDFPQLQAEIVEVLSPTNPLGIKAGGEGGTTPALAAVVNAVLDALGPLGVADIDMPVTSHRIWQAIQTAKAAQ